jgi:predicted Zn-dependent protease
MRKATILLLTLLAVTGCAVNPVTGKSELSFISEAEEISRGQAQYLPSQQSQGGLLTVDPELTAYVSQVGQRVAEHSDRALPYEFVVLNNGVPNAWALPGGKIAINRGLLLELNNEAELAAVLGHEAVHAAAKHGVNAMQRGMILQGVVAAAAIGVAASDADYGNYIIGGAQVGAQLINQRYGRGAELESDLYGIRYMAAAGYDPAAAISLQETFVHLSEGRRTSFLDGLFASHPPSIDRVNANRQTVAELGNPGGELGVQRYQDAIAFIKENQYAYQNFDEAQGHLGKRDYSGALRSLDAALVQLPQEPRFHGLRGNVYYQQRKYEKALTAFSRAVELDTNYFEYHLGLGLVESKRGNRSLAKQHLERSNQLLPTAVAANELGELSLAAGNRELAKQYFGAAMNVSGDVGQQASNSFVRLDIADNPNNYFEVQAGLTNDGFLIARVANRSGLDVNRVVVQFAASYNGAARTVNVPLAIKVNTIRDANPGWQFPTSEGLRYQVNIVTVDL